MAPKISSKGWIVIPADLRKKYGLKPGDEVHVIDYGGALTLVPAMTDPVRQTRGMFADGGPLLEDLLEERRRDLEIEEKKIASWAEDESGKP